MYQFMLDFLTWQTSCYKDGAIRGYLLKFKAANLQEKWIDTKENVCNFAPKFEKNDKEI